jgi:DNA-binding response OmpR family regulator
MDSLNSGSKVIAILEDDHDVRLGIELLLKSSGYQVIAGSSGEEVARLITEHRLQPTHIIADYRLGFRTAIEEVPVITAEASDNALVIVVTGCTSPETRALIEGYGWRLLIKPFPPAGLLSCLNWPPLTPS